MRFVLFSSVVFLLLFVLSCNQSPLQLINKGVALQEKKKYKEAIAKYNKALSKNAKLQMALYNRGVCYLNIDEPARALIDFNRVIHLKRPGDGQFIWETNADTPFADDEAKTQVPYNDVSYARAMAFYQLDSLQTAYEEFNQLVAKNYREKVSCILWQADIWHDTGNDSMACVYAKRANSLADDQDEINDASKLINDFCK